MDNTLLHFGFRIYGGYCFGEARKGRRHRQLKYPQLLCFSARFTSEISAHTSGDLGRGANLPFLKKFSEMTVRSRGMDIKKQPSETI